MKKIIGVFTVLVLFCFVFETISAQETAKFKRHDALVLLFDAAPDKCVESLEAVLDQNTLNTIENALLPPLTKEETIIVLDNAKQILLKSGVSETSDSVVAIIAEIDTTAAAIEAEKPVVEEPIIEEPVEEEIVLP